jgi:AcrR family transcriptional regulator
MVGVKGQLQARGVERRRAIVEAAIEHFAREGYRGTGTAAIAEAAGVTKGGLLHHFGSKEGLLIEVLKERDRQAVQATAPSADSLAGDFEQWVAVARWNEERPSLTALYTLIQAESVDPHHPAHAYMTERIAHVRRVLRRSLRRRDVRAGIDVDAKAEEILGFIEGAVLVWLRDPQPGSLSPVFRRYFDDQLTILQK